MLFHPTQIEEDENWEEGKFALEQCRERLPYHRHRVSYESAIIYIIADRTAWAKRPLRANSFRISANCRHFHQRLRLLGLCALWRIKGRYFTPL